jgi:predicted DNA-binding transcriptional regulator AlpA
MKPQLFSIDQAPAFVPIWHTMMDDLCNPPPERVARVLGISKRSVYRYNETGFAPKPVCLAVFWLTRWGRSAVNAQAINDAVTAIQYVEGLRSQVAQLEATVKQLVQIGDFGSANDPGSMVQRRPRALPR